jgi:chromosome segregation ATPase
MLSLKPKEGGSIPPPTPAHGQRGILVALAVALVAIAAVAYGQFAGKTALEERIATLEGQLQEKVNQLQKTTTSLESDIEVVTKRIGVTDQELSAARRYAEKLRVEQEQAREKLARELETKASATEMAAAREEAATKVAEVQKAADTKITSVSGEVKTVASNLEATRLDLAANRRDLSDVRTTLSEQIARNSSELAALRLKGERTYTEFDIKKGKKNEMTRVSDLRIELRDTDPKKQKYNVIVQVDDNKFEKKDRLANEPLEFRVGRDQLRYEIVVNIVDKDRIRGYVSSPKDKVLAAEGPATRD